MRRIEKGKEPKEWLKYRMTPGVEYQAIPELRKSLLKEQGYVCAYCMRRIPVRDKDEKGTPFQEDSRIEHIKCRDRYPELQLDYSNMVICCPGAVTMDFHCDRKKENTDITFDLFSQAFIETLSYSSKDGSIKSSNADYDNQINEVLNLNNKRLKANRLSVLREVINVMGKERWKKSQISHALMAWDSMDKDGRFRPYCGIVVWFMRRVLERTDVKSSHQKQ